ncbi:MAG TPA: zf-HC2 domain-containing protein [Pyrinomonadaceae bacterium]|nr:zf-HC2 domain-containing protein [Pyrinomonadaceae bacterium]
MTCDECQEHISLFLDNELPDELSASIRVHLAVCAECAKVCEDFAVILDSCRDSSVTEPLPPNSNALWCRINNIIESETKTEPKLEERPRGFFARGFTFGQLASAVVGIALISSLLTIVGTKNYFEPSGADYTSRSSASQTTFEKVLSKVGLIETPQQARLKRFQEQQAAIDYWDRRVQERRAQWDARMREAFDRNLNEIDQAVTEYTVILEKDPQDDLSGEMLDTALNEKMNLLRAFSEL